MRVRELSQARHCQVTAQNNNSSPGRFIGLRARDHAVGVFTKTRYLVSVAVWLLDEENIHACLARILQQLIRG
ncbi:unnamed protein product [Trichogramma brassicae]|uniref:Uncharacterized protein n=1 Tax=Trichogramma brassicae TaxID=86971 RepID=A0A6H5I678_9HYME|nr:unnamed protein product [Trichogramma brassicae]